MSPSIVDWDGPLFYPPVGKIAVTHGGSRIEVWPDESQPDCFTGLMLVNDRSAAQRAVFDLSSMWDRLAIDHIEKPSPSDIELSGLTGGAA